VRNQPPQNRENFRLGNNHLIGKTNQNNENETAYNALQPAETPGLQQQNYENIYDSDGNSPTEGDTKKEVQGNGRSQDFGKVHGGNGNFAEQPKNEIHHGMKMIFTGLS